MIIFLFNVDFIVINNGWLYVLFFKWWLIVVVKFFWLVKFKVKLFNSGKFKIEVIVLLMVVLFV